MTLLLDGACKSLHWVNQRRLTTGISAPVVKPGQRVVCLVHPA